MRTLKGSERTQDSESIPSEPLLGFESETDPQAPVLILRLQPMVPSGKVLETLGEGREVGRAPEASLPTSCLFFCVLILPGVTNLMVHTVN